MKPNTYKNVQVLIDIALNLGSFIKVIKRLKINILISDYFAFSIRQSVKCLNSNLSFFHEKIKNQNSKFQKQFFKQNQNLNFSFK